MALRGLHDVPCLPEIGVDVPYTAVIQRCTAVLLVVPGILFRSNVSQRVSFLFFISSQVNRAQILSYIWSFYTAYIDYAPSS